jgi:hypothetical protein
MLFDQPKAENQGCLRDFTAYVLIGCAFVAAMWGLGDLAAKHGWATEAPGNWIGFGFITLIAFGDVAYVLWRHSSCRRSWLVWASALVLQCGIGGLLLGYLPRVPTFVWAIALPFDELAIGAYIGALTEPGARTLGRKASGRTKS